MSFQNSWKTPLKLAGVFFLADQLLKVFSLRELAPGDQLQFLGQSFFALTHLATDTPIAASVLQWGLWFLLAIIILLRLGESSFLEKVSSLLVLTAALSNILTRTLLGTGLNVFVFQSGVNSPLFSFNLAHVAIAIGSLILLATWVKALWPETISEASPT